MPPRGAERAPTAFWFCGRLTIATVILDAIAEGTAVGDSFSFSFFSGRIHYSFFLTFTSYLTLISPTLSAKEPLKQYSFNSSNSFRPRFLKVEIAPRILANVRAPAWVRNPPDTFSLTLTIRIACSARLFVNGTSSFLRNANTLSR